MPRPLILLSEMRVLFSLGCLYGLLWTTGEVVGQAIPVAGLVPENENQVGIVSQAVPAVVAENSAILLKNNQVVRQIQPEEATTRSTSLFLAAREPLAPSLVQASSDTRDGSPIGQRQQQQVLFTVPVTAVTTAAPANNNLSQAYLNQGSLNKGDKTTFVIRNSQEKQQSAEKTNQRQQNVVITAPSPQLPQLPAIIRRLQSGSPRLSREATSNTQTSLNTQVISREASSTNGQRPQNEEQLYQGLLQILGEAYKPLATWSYGYDRMKARMAPRQPQQDIFARLGPRVNRVLAAEAGGQPAPPQKPLKQRRA